MNQGSVGEGSVTSLHARARSRRRGALDRARKPDLTRAPGRSRAETRRRLVGAATALFARRGLHGAKIADIAAEAGVATGTFYLHFTDKQSLLREIVFDALDRLRARLADARLRAGEIPHLAVREQARELLGFAEENRNLVRLLFGREPEAAGFGEAVLDDLLPDIEARMRERVAAGQLDASLHPAVAAQAVAAMWTRVIAWWVEHPERAPREAVVATLVRVHPGAGALPDARSR